jgi:hypothetical protein
MLLTFGIELALAAYVVVRYRMGRLTRLATLLLLCLAAFQLSEYLVCGGTQVEGEVWSKIGFVAITLLLPLGLHITQSIVSKPAGYLTWIAYAMSLGWIYLFTLSQQAFLDPICGGNYVIFQLASPWSDLYTVYYFAWLVITMGIAVRHAKSARPRIKRALSAQVWGYATFLIPTTTLNLIWPHTIAGIPSIMCGFALIFAFILVIIILPLERTRRNSKKGKHA